MVAERQPRNGFLTSKRTGDGRLEAHQLLKRQGARVQTQQSFFFLFSFETHLDLKIFLVAACAGASMEQKLVVSPYPLSIVHCCLGGGRFSEVHYAEEMGRWSLFWFFPEL
ncbi:hypothetical protein CRG98_020699 [Punica granatum]|uniref:Uncharacterized protein n=1 Tax=Punica granatum TaxID=22663 RepID=A0A2I0JSV5_PUNGR|nr:hypothetical protein CRG98_020699 [Punica granatum]